LNDVQIQRYSRHLLLPEIGGKGQRRIAEAKILVIGAGGWARRRRCIWPQPVWARSAWSTGTRSICPTCTGR
jgi:hypothetical protein